MNETVAYFGKFEHLFGVYCASRIMDQDKPTIVMWNTGISTHCGPNRINVDLARAFAKLGFASLRFDLSGLGESHHRKDGLAGQEKNNQDCLEALTYLRQEKGANRFILIGNCSGAIDAHFLAASQSDVIGLSMVDTYVYPTTMFYFHYYRKRLFKLDRWHNYLQRKKTERLEGAPLDIFAESYPDQFEISKDLQKIVDRGCKINVIYTGGFEYQYTYHNQFYDMFSDVDFGNALSLQRYPNADHLFTIVEHRRDYLNELTNWVNQEFTEKNSLLALPEVSNRKLLSAQIARHTFSDRTAIYTDDLKVSYRELEELSNAGANYLLAAGLLDEEPIALDLPRGVELIIAVLAAVKAGIPVVPLAAGMDKNAKAKLKRLVSCRYQIDLQAENQFSFEKLMTGSVEPPSKVPHEHDKLYILFTSGTTGEPKSIAISHGLFENLITWQIEQNIDRPKTLQFSPINFDVSFQEIFATLGSGGCLYPITENLKRSAAHLLPFVEKNQISQVYLPFAALKMLIHVALEKSMVPKSLKQVITAGEALIVSSEVREFFAESQAKLINQYGPSETHVITSYELPKEVSDWPQNPPIGRALPGFELLLDSDDEAAELIVSSPLLEQDYFVSRQKKTSFFQKDGKRFYRTGDLCFLDHKKLWHTKGRIDHQVKINGFRIELAAIESIACQLPQIEHAVAVKIKQDDNEQLCLVYYGKEELQLKDLRELLSRSLPDYMLPHRITKFNEVPFNRNGKVDRSAIEQLVRDQNSQSDSQAKLSKNQINQNSVHRKRLDVIRDLLTNLIYQSVGETPQPDDNFFMLGLTSVQAVKLALQIDKNVDCEVTALDLYDAPTIDQLIAKISHKLGSPQDKRVLPVSSSSSEFTSQTESDFDEERIAVVGMAGRFPGAANISNFWANLINNKESGYDFTIEELQSAGIENCQDKNYVARRGILERYRNFDHKLFGFNLREASLLDPQHRIFLEESYNALIDARLLDRSDLKGSVFASNNHTHYYNQNILHNTKILNRHGSFNAMVANDSDYMATRTAYCLNLSGASMQVGTACSSSLVAIAEAVLHIKNGFCDFALAGGASLTVPVFSGHLYEEGSIRSRDGYCRPFSKDASGTYFSDGCGVVVLMPLKKAIAADCRIYATISGIGLNNDGRDKASYSSPSIKGQTECLNATLKDAKLHPNQIDFVECHGTGTKLGDPLEIEALYQAYGKRNRPLLIGSVKSNIGHLASAAGVTGLIKTCLSLHYRRLPASLFAEETNPLLKLDQRPFRVATKSEDLKKGILHAGVSSFGIGGTNCHIILQSFLNKEPKTSRPFVQNYRFLSANSAEAIQRSYEQVIDQSRPQDTNFSTRYSPKDPFGKLLCLRDNRCIYSADEQVAQQPLGFIFPGQGSQQAGMTRKLYSNFPAFEAAFDQVAQIFKEQHNLDLFKLTRDSEQKITMTEFAQPLIFASSFAYCKMLETLSINPDYLVGHSIGEICAAAFGEYLSIEDAVKLCFHRGRLMQDAKPGQMLAVRTDKDLQRILKEKHEPSHLVEVAVHNNENEYVLAGTQEAILNIQGQLDQLNIKHRHLKTSHAFHSTLMKSIATEFAEVLQQLEFRKGTKAVISTVDLRQWQDNPPNAQYWLDHAFGSVRFFEALQKQPQSLLCEVGTGQTLSGSIKRSKKLKHIVVGSGCAKTGQDENRALKEAVLGLHLFQRRVPSSKVLEKLAVDLGTNHPFIGDAFQNTECWYESDLKTKSTRAALREESTMSHNDDNYFAEISEVLLEAAGVEVTPDRYDSYFLELGLDSLFLTQLASNLRKKFECEISFRGLGEDYPTVNKLNEHIKKIKPRTASMPSRAKNRHDSEDDVEVEIAKALDQSSFDRDPSKTVKTSFCKDPQVFTDRDPTNDIFQKQLDIMHKQLELLGANNHQTIEKPTPPSNNIEQSENNEIQKSQVESSTPQPAQATMASMTNFLQAKPLQSSLQFDGYHFLLENYVAKRPKSKELAGSFRKQHADPRSAVGFHEQVKELIFPIHVAKGDGAHIICADDHRYLDMSCGFGSMFFGHNHPRINHEMQQAINKGCVVGPQDLQVGKLAEELSLLLGLDRIAFCNTGSEAVLGALRIARSATGRNKILIFKGAYHGIFDEVLVKRVGNTTFPGATGILKESLGNVLIADYDDPKTFALLDTHKKDLAAVLVEPVQSRNPSLVPEKFLKKLRSHCKDMTIPFILDEVITGFRIAPSGINKMFDLNADLVTYGKIIGGGQPIGLIAGQKKYMDYLDGGAWKYGDDSKPESGVTFFAGTFVRHPLTIAASKATIELIKNQEIYDNCNLLAKTFAAGLKGLIEEFEVPITFGFFRSMMYLKFPDGFMANEIFAAWLRMNGVFYQANLPFFVSAAMTAQDIQFALDAFKKTFKQMVEFELLPGNTTKSSSENDDGITEEETFLGLTPQGEPALFKPDPNRPGKYLMKAYT